MKLQELNRRAAEVDALVSGEVVDTTEDDTEEEGEEEYEATMEGNLTQATDFLERVIILLDSLIDSRLNNKNRISYKVSEQIHGLSEEIWQFLQTLDGDYSPVTYVDITNELGSLAKSGRTL